MSQKNSKLNHNPSIHMMSAAVVGINSEADALHIKNQLLDHHFISEVDVCINTQLITVYYDISIIHKKNIITLIESLGCKIQSRSLLTDALIDNQITFSTLFSKNVLVLLSITTLFIIQTLGVYFGKDFNWLFGLHVEFLLASFVQFFLGFPLYKKLYRSIKTGMNNTDILVIIATQMIWMYSTFIYLYLIGIISVSFEFTDIYFYVSVIVLALTVIGQLIQKVVTNHQLRSDNIMDRRTPKLVECLTRLNKVKVVEFNKLKSGYVVQLKEGDITAGDGLVVSGCAWFNESHLTGNNTLIQKKKGDLVLSGSTLENGQVTYQIHHLGRKTRFGSMINFLTTAQKSRMPLSLPIDSLLRVFVPTVLIIATVKLFNSYYIEQILDVSILQASVILIVACPCIFWLSTSTAVIAGTGIAANYGIWFKDAASLKKVANIDTIVLNKTHTLTQGQFKLVSHYFFDSSIRLLDILQLTASVESQFTNPIALSICSTARQKGISLLPVTEAQSYAGKGVEAIVVGMGLVRIGSPKWVGTELPESIQKNLPKPFKAASLVAVSINEIPLGFLVLMDELRGEVQEAITHLQELGINMIIMSGDNPEPVAAISDKLGVLEFFANMTPDKKADKINALKVDRGCVAMVGTGENDTAAMVNADVCFDINYDVTTRQNSVSAILMGKSLKQFYEAKVIATATIKVMKQNLYFSLFYNILAVLIAFLGYLNPVTAALLMIFSTILVLVNVGRLNYFKPD